MALTPAQQQALAGMIAQEGGLSTFFTEVQALYIANTQTTALATLAPAITVTVQNWTTLGAYIAAPANAPVVATVMAAINTAATARDATPLGPLMVALYAAIKANTF